MQNSRAFTLIEVIIAMFILMVGMLALLNTAAVIIENNLVNIIRDEAVKVGDQKMDELRNTSLAPTAWSCAATSRVFRSVTTEFNVCARVTNLSSDGNTKQVDVAVGWNHKGTGALSPTGRKYQHSLSSVVRVGS
jgi:Tfp pilus assembly protein PilV